MLVFEGLHVSEIVFYREYDVWDYKIMHENILFDMQDRLIDFNVTVCEEFIAMVSESTLPLTLKKLILVKFWCSIKEYPKLSAEILSILSFPFQLVWGQNFFLHFNQNNILQQVECKNRAVRIQLSSKPEIREIVREASKTLTSLFPRNFFFNKLFFTEMLFM